MLNELNESVYGATIEALRVAAIGYADDVLLLADTEEDMNGLLSICERYGKELSIQWNPTKSTTMVIGEKKINNKKSKEAELIFCGKRIDRVQQTKHLRYEQYFGN